MYDYCMKIDGTSLNSLAQKELYTSWGPIIMGTSRGHVGDIIGTCWGHLEDIYKGHHGDIRGTLWHILGISWTYISQRYLGNMMKMIVICFL